MSEEQKKHLEDCDNYITFLQSHKETLEKNVLKELYELKKRIEKLIEFIEKNY